MEIKRILVPTDGSNNSTLAMDMATKLAKELGASIHSLYVIEKVPKVANPGANEREIVKAESKVDADRALTQMKDKAETAGIPYDDEVLIGIPADAIIAESENFDMIVMSSVGKSGLQKAIIGSVSQKVVTRAKCPVTVVKPTDHL